jgi:mRNA interferase MazF
VKYRRGDIVLAASPGDYGKPRPCLVLQSKLFDDLPSVTFCMLTTTLRDDSPLIRIGITPNNDNGLHQPSQIAIDKIMTLPTTRITRKLGMADEDVMLQVTRALAVFLGLG